MSINSDPAPDQLVVILGMHRSGTSLITKSIELFGYSAGDRLMPADEDNPKGFFEDLDIVAFNDELLRANRSTWDAPLLALGNAEPAYDTETETSARALLREKFSETKRLVLKDPRMCLLMPFWAAQFDALGIEVHYVGVHRHPLDVAASLTRRNGMTTRHGLLLDYFYNRSMMHFLGEDAFVVDYANLLQEPDRELNRLSEFLGVEPPEEARSGFLGGFLDRKLNHHRHTAGELVASSESFAALNTLSDTMLAMASGQPATLDKHDVDTSLGTALLSEVVAYQVAERFAAEQAEQSVQVELGQVKNGLSQAEFDLKDLEQRLSEREQHIEVLGGETDRLGRELDKTNRVLKTAEQELDQERTNNLQLIDTRTALETSLSEARATLDALKASGLKLKQELDDQLEVHAAEVLAYQNSISELEEKVATLYGYVKGYEEQVAGYQQHLVEFDRKHREVLGSVSFRLGRLITYPVRKPLTSWILPRLQENPVALRVAQLLRQCISHPIKTLRLLSIRRLKNFYLLMTERQDLVDQIVSNYESVLVEDEAKPDVHVHQHSEEDLARLDIAFREYESPRVSVLIPVYNQLDYTLKCLKSICDHAPEVSFEVVVADDCSTDQTEEILARIPGLRVVRHEKNLRFLLSCNRAVDYCRGDYVYLLNNDTAVKAGWLDALVESFEQHPDAGLVGSKLVYPDGRLQEAGGIVWNDASAWNYGRFQDPEKPEYNYFKETDYVSGAAIMVPRQLFLDLGKFDESLAPAYYEDTDLAFKVRAAGKKVYLQPKSVVVHYEGVSNGTDESAGLKQYQVENQSRFLEKWQDVLSAGHFPNGESVMQARDRSSGRTTVLVIDHYVPHFDKDAGSRSTFQYLELMVRAGCNVKFLGDNFFKHEPYTSVLQDMGIEVLYGSDYEKQWKSWLKQNHQYIDVIYLMRPHITERYIDVINELPNRPRTIYFGHDLHYMRLERQAEANNDAEARKEAAFWRKKEYELFSKVDLVYYPSQVEVTEILSNQPDLNVKAIPLYAFEHFNDSPVNPVDRAGLIFVGGFGHPPNADGLSWFVESVMPLVLAELPELQLHVVGSNMPVAITELAGENIVIHGFLSDEALAELYDQVRLSIVPLRFGAGIKGKVLEAMDRGIPVVTTAIGAEGIPSSAETLFLAEEASEMAATIVRNYEDFDLLSERSARGRDVIQTHFSTDAVRRVIAEDFMMKTA